MQSTQITPNLNSPISVSSDTGKFALINDGQLFLGNYESDKLTNIQFDHPVINVYRSDLRIGVVTADGSCYIWKNSIISKNHKPKKVDLGYPYRAKKIVFSLLFNCLLLEDGTIAYWGIYASQEYNLKMDLSAIDIATDGDDIDSKFMAVTKNGEVYSWGESSVLKHNLPRELKMLTFPEPIVKLTIGSSHTLVLSKEGNVYAFGKNKRGQLAQDRSVKKSEKPIKVDLPEPIKFISAFSYGSLAITISGRLFGWGVVPFEIKGLKENNVNIFRTTAFRVGYDIYNPIEINLGQPVEYIDGSYKLTISITKDGNFNFLKRGRDIVSTIFTKDNEEVD